MLALLNQFYDSVLRTEETELLFRAFSRNSPHYLQHTPIDIALLVSLLFSVDAQLSWHPATSSTGIINGAKACSICFRMKNVVACSKHI